MRELVEGAARELAKASSVELVQRHSDDAAARDETGDGQVKQARQELAPRQVARGAEQDDQVWVAGRPRANRFGLIDAMVASTWCSLEGKLAYVGGAGACFPRLDCGEWAGFLCAASVLHWAEPTSYHSHGLRPVVSLASFAG